ncbi:Uncharacterized protein HZ326_29147 [Fusarium oxysporum f. sp. albedinis]|nr:Uncharacterized protein HZ326_29147 [Fusarium oxysporum f. sp. albedinis]
MPSLFFNAVVVQTHTDGNGGAIVFVDTYTAWVSGPMAQSNRGGIQATIDKAHDWKRRSRIDSEPFTKGEMVVPRDQVKVLGVIMDLHLHCK